MEKVTVYNIKGEKVKEMDLNPDIFGLEIKPELVQQAVIAQQANSRQNLAHTKDRSDIRGGGKKPWRQKGTGRARHGSIRSPLWIGGGVTFGPRKNRNYSTKINRKAKSKAMLMSLSDKATNHKIVLLDKLELEEAKTKKVFEMLQNLKLRQKKEVQKKSKQTEKKEADKKAVNKVKNKKPSVKSVLVVLPSKNDKVKRATSNINKVDTILADSLNVVDILKNQYLLLPVDSLEKIKKTFISVSAPTKVSAKAEIKANKKK
ncbi:MAG: 50S ribosomal protein L4 [Parcubacteria group bacterium]|nr:50S ribosomal protein L4 [Parcubacteria group bacterium]|tara:strand:- start:24635 stop:25417 length:783 start_codon:yes stop_codon:yes gene_type:complete